MPIGPLLSLLCVNSGEVWAQARGHPEVEARAGAPPADGKFIPKRGRDLPGHLAPGLGSLFF